jgi:prephenate dehydrogenase
MDQKMNSIAIVGAAGSLGSVVSRYCADSKQTVKLLLVDENVEKLETLQKEFDYISITVLSSSEFNLEALTTCDIIHWCIPLSAISNYPLQNLTTSTLSVFHDSVMSRSQNVINTLGLSNACAVHMLMNTSETVVIDNNSPCATATELHFATLTLSPIRLSVNNHDLLLAKSQSMVALLCHEYLGELAESNKLGLLTPSGEELLHALKHRESRWTKPTLDSLLANPMLEKTLTQLLNKVKST